MDRIAGDWINDKNTRTVMQMLTNAGHQAWFVGGCVRDALACREVSDIDITTDARPDVVIGLAKGLGLNAIGTGIDHGTVTVISGRPFEITTFRKDIETDGRHAVIEFAGRLQDDAMRRDLTINAIYADQFGAICDPVGGVQDLRNKRIRFIGEAQDRIREDYLRSLRYFRFYARFGDPDQGPDPEAIAAIAANLPGIDTVSKERIGSEMMKMLSVRDPAPALGVMAATGALAMVLDGAEPVDVSRLVAFEGADLTPNPIRRLAALTSVDPTDSLRLSNKDARAFTQISRAARDGTPAHDSGYRLGQEIAEHAIYVRAALTQTPPTQRDFDLARLGAKARFPVSAADLAPLAGRELGEKLKMLETRWIDAQFQLTKQELLA